MPKDEFLRAYRAASKKLAEAYERVHIKGTYRRFGWPADDGRDLVKDYEVWKSGDMVRAQYVLVSGKSAQQGRRAAQVATPQRSFLVGSEADQPRFSLTDAGTAYKEAAQRAYGGCAAPIAPFALFSSILEDWIGDPRFEIKSVDEAVEDGMKIVSVSFHWHTTKVDGTPGFQTCKVSFYPEKSWAVREYSKGVETFRCGRVTYEGEIAGAPLVKKIENWKREKDGTRTMREEFALESFDADPVDPALFTLASFGIGDIVEQPGNRRLYYLLLAAGAVLLLLPFVIRTIQGRRRSPG